MARLRIGCSGFLYDHWKGAFYPEDLPRNQWFSYYCKFFSTVELNVTFYGLPERETFAKWHTVTPADFVFALKGSRFITHVKKLKDCAEPVEAFFSRASVLKDKLDVVLWQLPPSFAIDLERLRKFLGILRHFHLRNAFEFRNKTWINKTIFTLLAKENVALCIADHPDFLNDLPSTADFLYIRRHGTGGNHATSYSTEALIDDAKFINAHLKKKEDVFIYFNNDAAGYAPNNALELARLVETKKK